MTRPRPFAVVVSGTCSAAESRDVLSKLLMALQAQFAPHADLAGVTATLNIDAAAERVVQVACEPPTPRAQPQRVLEALVIAANKQTDATEKRLLKLAHNIVAYSYRDLCESAEVWNEIKADAQAEINRLEKPVGWKP